MSARVTPRSRMLRLLQEVMGQKSQWYTGGFPEKYIRRSRWYMLRQTIPVWGEADVHRYLKKEVRKEELSR
jgi:hypothetical protein